MYHRERQNSHQHRYRSPLFGSVWQGSGATRRGTRFLSTAIIGLFEFLSISRIISDHREFPFDLSILRILWQIPICNVIIWLYACVFLQGTKMMMRSRCRLSSRSIRRRQASWRTYCGHYHPSRICDTSPIFFSFLSQLSELARIRGNTRIYD